MVAEASVAKIDGGSGIGGDQETAGLTGEWQHALGPYDQITAYAQASIVRYPEQRIRDVNRFTGGLGYGHAFAETKGTPIAFATVFGGIDDPQSESRGEHFGRDFFGGRIGASIQPVEHHTFAAALTYQRSKHDARDPAFLVKRKDHPFSGLAQYRFQYDENWSIAPHISFTKTDSNIIVNEYDRFEAMIIIRNDF